MDSTAPVSSSAYFVCKFGYCYSGKADSVFYMLSYGNLKFGKNLRVSCTKLLKTIN